jgi:hypothetical protein
MGRLVVCGLGARLGCAGEKEKVGWAVRVEWVRVSFVFFLFFQFLFSHFFSNFYSKPFQNFKPTFEPHHQSKAHAFNIMHNHLVISKLINYYFIYLKANLIIQIY